MMKYDPTCPACKKPWSEHDGIERTCWALTESRKRESALVDALRLLRYELEDHDNTPEEVAALNVANALLPKT